MFICNLCLQGYDNLPSITLSVGSCEICDAIASCSDIPAGHLRAKSTVDADTFAVLEPTRDLVPAPTLELVRAAEPLDVEVLSVVTNAGRSYSRKSGGDPLLTAITFDGPDALIGGRMHVRLREQKNETD